MSRTLWHYTSLSVLIAIWESKSLLGTEYRFLNDRTEWTYGVEQLDKWRRRTKKEIASKLSPTEKLYDRHLGGYNNPFVYSFSAVPDDLTMWRAYGDIQNRSEAVAIGFDVEDLNNICAQNQARQPRPCEYSQDEIYDQFERQIGPNGHTNVDATALLFLLANGPFFKHWTFEHEAEWRIVATLSGDPLKSASRLKPMGNSYRMPLDLTGASNYPLGIKSVFTGPTTSFERVLAFAEYSDLRFKAETMENLTRMSVQRSNVPYV